MPGQRQLVPIDLAKHDGPRLRAPKSFVNLTENLIMLAGLGNPNKGMPDLIVKAYRQMIEEDPKIIDRALEATARQQGVSVNQLKAVLRKYKPEVVDLFASKPIRT